MSDNQNPLDPQGTEAELKAKIVELEAAKVALTGELTTSKPKLREAQDKIDLLTQQLTAAVDKNNANPEETKIAEVVARVLSQGEATRATNNRKTALDKFVTANKEFSPDNDPGGLKKAALERELSSLKTWETAVEVDDLLGVIGKANTYLRGQDTSRQTETTVQPFSSSSAPASPPNVTGDGDLSPQEKKLLEQNGMSKEDFLKLKAKMPDFVEGLVERVR